MRPVGGHNLSVIRKTAAKIKAYHPPKHLKNATEVVKSAGISKSGMPWHLAIVFQ
jgi:hypothetical protein